MSCTEFFKDGTSTTFCSEFFRHLLCLTSYEYDTLLLLLFLLQKSNESLRYVCDSNMDVVSHTSKRSFYEFLQVFFSSLLPQTIPFLRCILTHFIAVILITNKFRFNFLALLPNARANGLQRV